MAMCGLIAGASQPYYSVVDATYSAITDVNVSDTAASLQIMMVNRPGYWCALDSLTLVGRSTGTVYPTRSLVGYTYGERKFMPESGRYDFTVNFSPVDAADSIVDLMENGRVLFGQLRLDGSAPSACNHTRIHGRLAPTASAVVLKQMTSTGSGQRMWIPVDNGEFSFTCRSDSTMAYEIVEGQQWLHSSYYGGCFFSENADIEFDFRYDGNGKICQVDISAPEGSLTAQVSAVYRMRKRLWDESHERIRRDSLEAAGKMYAPEFAALLARLESNPEERDSLVRIASNMTREQMYTPEAIEAQDACNEFSDRVQTQVLYEAGRMKSLAGLYLLISRAWRANDKTPMVDIYRHNYQGLFPGHPYDEYFALLIASDAPVVGNRFLDFSAPDFEGNVHRLSDLISGRPALIDLWASWCAPCRRASKSMIPVWEEFEPKGFTIVGVAREYNSPEKGLKAIKADGYSWTNLLELDDAGHVWDLYRLSNAAGGTFLVNPDGIIVAVNPTADYVRAYLADFYK